MTTVFRALVLASSVTAWMATEAVAAEYQCWKSDSSLRIAIEVKKAGHTLPCEVIAEDDRGQRAVLYSARYDRDYCPARIERTREELEQEGWACEKTSDENIVGLEGQPIDNADRQTPASDAGDTGSGGALVAGSGKVITTSLQCSKQNDLRRIRIEVEDVTRGRPCQLIYWADGDQSKPGQLLWRAEHDATFCPQRLEVITRKWVGEGWHCEASGTQTAAVVTTPVARPESTEAVDQALATPDARAEEGDLADAVTPDPDLEAIIAADAERIGEWMDVEPAIEIAARGDLNDDGSDDAVVFMAYQSEQSAYRQYLMGYLVADRGYELAGVKLLTGVNPPPAQARV